MLLKFPINKIVIVGTRYDEDVEGLAAELSEGASARGLGIRVETTSHLNELKKTLDVPRKSSVRPDTLVLLGRHVRYQREGLCGTRTLGVVERSKIANGLRRETRVLVTGFERDKATGRYTLDNI